MTETIRSSVYIIIKRKEPFRSPFLSLISSEVQLVSYFNGT